MAVREIPWFYGRSRKNDRPIRKIAGFTDDLKKPVLIAPLRAANVVQNPKEKSQIIENQGLAICCVPCGLSVFEPVYGRFG